MEPSLRRRIFSCKHTIRIEWCLFNPPPVEQQDTNRDDCNDKKYNHHSSCVSPILGIHVYILKAILATHVPSPTPRSQRYKGERNGESSTYAIVQDKKMVSYLDITLFW